MPSLAHRRARVGVAGSDLDVAQVNPSVEHGRDEGMAKHVWMCPGDAYARGFGEPSQATVAA